MTLRIRVEKNDIGRGTTSYTDHDFADETPIALLLAGRTRGWSVTITKPNGDYEVFRRIDQEGRLI